METDNAFDELCHVLVKHQTSLKQKWKFSHGKKADCVLCTATEGPLLKCKQDRCEHYMHIDCAASTTALYFDDNTSMLTCWCESHFEPILFCSCKTPYDESKPMVYCDECCEWYHHACEKLTDADIDQDNYMCTSCKKLSLRGSRVSDEIREKNHLKDVLYAQCNAGLSIANIWQSVDTDFCNKIDIVNKHSHEEQAISKVDFDAMLYILDAMANANKADDSNNNSNESAMDTETNTPSNNGEDMTGWKDLTRALGEQTVVSTWRQQMVDFSKEVTVFQQDVLNVTHKLKQQFTVQFHAPPHDMIVDLSNLIRNMKDICQNKLRIIVEIDVGCAKFEENFDWMKEFVKLLHGLTTSDRWLATMKTHCRKLNTTLRGLEEIKEDVMWADYAAWFAEYMQAAVSLTEKVAYWCNQWHAISKGNSSTTFANIVALHEAALTFPMRIVFVDELENWLHQCKELDAKITALVTQHDDIDQTAFEALKTEASSLSIVLSTDWLYISLNQYFIFQTAYTLAMADRRVERDSLDVLIAAASDVLSLWQTASSDMRLIVALKAKVEASSQCMQTLLEESEQVVGAIPREDFDEADKIDALLPQLSALRVITAEEKFILMVKDFNQCVEQVQSITSRTVAKPINEVQSVLDGFLRLYNLQITGEFMSLSSKRAVMRKNISALNELLAQANQQWKNIEMAIEDLSRGKSISSEHLQELLAQSHSLLISHPAVEAKVQQAMEEGRVVEIACEALLAQSNHDAEAKNMEEVLAMLKTMQHHVVSANVSKRVRARYDVFQLQQTCQELLSKYSPDDQTTALLPPIELVPGFQSAAKDLHKVEALVKDVGICIEQQILSRIAVPILMVDWYIQAHDVLHNKDKVQFSRVEELLALAQGRLAATTVLQSATFATLTQAVHDFQGLKATIAETMHAFDAWNTSTLLATLPQALQHIAVSEPSQLFVIVEQLATYLTSMKDTILDFHQKTKQLMQQVVTDVLFTDDHVEEVGGLMNYCHFLYLSFATVAKLHENVQRPADPTGKQQSSVDMKHIAELIACQKAFAVSKSSALRFELSKTLTEVYSQLQQACTSWIASKQELMMLKQARNKQKLPDGGSAPPTRVSVSQEDVVTALNEGIAKMIRTPQHDRLVAVLCDIERIHERLLHLLAPGLVPPSSTTAAVSAAEEKVAIGEDDEDEVAVFEEQVGTLLEQLKSVREELSLVPVDSCDSYVINYISQVLGWMLSVPHPDDQLSSQIIRMVEAKKKVVEAAPIISEIEEATIHKLMEFGLMNEEGFIPQAHPYLKRAVDFLTFLEQHVDLCQQFQHKVSLLLKSNEKLDILEALLAEKQKLIVIPDTDLMRSLDREIALKKPKQVVSATPTASSSAVPSTAGVAAVSKSSKSRHPCLANCGNSIRPQLSIAYCSDRCMKQHVDDMMLSLLEYRYLLHDFYHQQPPSSAPSSNTAPLTNLTKRGKEDMKAFELVDTAEVASTGDGPRLKTFLDLVYFDDRWSVADIALKSTTTKKSTFLDRMAVRLPKAAAFIAHNEQSSKPDMEHPTSAFLGVLTAMEVEEGLFHKYAHGRSLEKVGLQQYQKHIQMLMVNLRQPHNEHYTEKLSKTEIPMEQFLALTASEFANKELQLMRQQGVDSIKQASHRASTEEEMENMVRLAMSGQESWRDGVRSTSKDAADASTIAANNNNNNNNSSKPLVIDTDSFASSSTEMDVDSPNLNTSTDAYEEEEGNVEPESTRFLEIESKILNSKNTNSNNNSNSATAAMRTPKRPLEIDASTRITRDDPKLKFAKLDPIIEHKPASAEKAPRNSTSATEAVPKVLTPTAKAPNFLEMLKAKQAATAAEGAMDAKSPSKTHAAASPPSITPNSASTSSSSAISASSVGKPKPLSSPFTPCMKMLNKDGNEDFTVTRRGGILLRATGLLSERRLQGTVKNSFNIDGRTKIADLDKFIKESIAANRKILGTFTLYISNGSTESYKKFCDEFVKDQRAGISNVSDTTQVYLIPPALKPQVQLLQHLHLENAGHANILYGVLVGKAPGPSLYTEMQHAMVPYDLHAFTTPQDGVHMSPAAPKPTSIPPPVAPMMPTSMPNAFSAAPNAFSAPPAPVLRSPVINLDQIREVAKVCASKGVAYIKAMKEKPDSKLVVPFIFEGNPGYDAFIQILSEFTMGGASSANNAFSSMPAASSSQPRPKSRFN